MEISSFYSYYRATNNSINPCLQFVCMGGTPKRMEEFAYYIMKEIGHRIPTGTKLDDISQYSYRYSMYKVGPVLAVSVSTNTVFFALNLKTDISTFIFVVLLRRNNYFRMCFTAWYGHPFHQHPSARDHQADGARQSEGSDIFQDRHMRRPRFGRWDRHYQWRSRGCHAQSLSWSRKCL